VRKICRSIVVNIPKENDRDPGHRRGEETWGAFLRRHAQTRWATDFFTKRT
jgi:hypothetical protein